MSILPAGRLHKSPHALLGKGLLKELLDEVRPLYRYIIIDTPPVLSASESLVFAKAADGALICTMREVSRAPQVRMTYDRLVAAGVSTIGVVLNGVPSSRYASKYGSYAYSRGSRSPGKSGRRAVAGFRPPCQTYFVIFSIRNLLHLSRYRA